MWPSSSTLLHENWDLDIRKKNHIFLIIVATIFFPNYVSFWCYNSTPLFCLSVNPLSDQSKLETLQGQIWCGLFFNQISNLHSKLVVHNSDCNLFIIVYCIDSNHSFNRSFDPFVKLILPSFVATISLILTRIVLSNSAYKHLCETHPQDVSMPVHHVLPKLLVFKFQLLL